MNGALPDLPPVLFLDTADFPAPAKTDFISPHHPRSMQNPDEVQFSFQRSVNYVIQK